MRVEKLLKRLKREFIKVNLLQASLDTLLFFLTANLVLSLLSIRVTQSFSNPQSLLGLSLIIFIADLYYRAKNYRLEIFEEKNPELRERLRTARDNLESTNIVSQALFDEVLDRSRTVTSESIIPSKKIIQKMVVVGILSFLTVLSGIANFQLMEDGGELLPEVEDLERQITGEDDEGFQLKNGSEIYGDRKDIDVSGQLVDFNITGSGETEDSELESTDARPEEVRLDVSGPALSEDLELAKRYSLEIKQLE